MQTMTHQLQWLSLEVLSVGFLGIQREIAGWVLIWEGAHTKDSFAACLSHFEQSIASFLLFFPFVSSYVSILLDPRKERLLWVCDELHEGIDCSKWDKWAPNESLVTFTLSLKRNALWKNCVSFGEEWPCQGYLTLTLGHRGEKPMNSWCISFETECIVGSPLSVSQAYMSQMRTLIQVLHPSKICCLNSWYVYIFFFWSTRMSVHLLGM